MPPELIIAGAALLLMAVLVGVMTAQWLKSQAMVVAAVPKHPCGFVPNV
jgi:hypothetical protein